MTRTGTFGFLFVGIAVALCCPSPVPAVDFEVFEFNDANGTVLAGAANSANPGNNWFEGAGMGSSDIRGGSYNIVKQSTALVSNYLQIADITSGTRYLVARMSGWDFYQNPGDGPEEFRLAFLNDNTGTSGATITAQMNIRREAGGENIVLVGSALGVGSADIAGAPVLNTTQTNPFTIALELNKTANSYKVFYKDGTNATQVLGLGSVAPTRNGNSVRMAVNGDFQTFGDYPSFMFEHFSVDRIALTDTNPFTDLITLEIDRDNAAMTLRNTSGATLSGIQSYSITSATGALNPAGWSPGAATPTTSTNAELAATFGSPINLANNATLSLSTGPGAWLKSPFEDMQMVLNLTGGITRTVNVNFIDNGGVKFQNGDFDFNNTINSADWLHFIANAETDIASLSRARRYQLGDLNGDGSNSIADFLQFKALYDAANGGAGAFDAMLAGLNVPEPSSAILLGAAGVFLTMRRRRRRNSPRIDESITENESSRTTRGASMMMRIRTFCITALATAAMLIAASTARAAILEDFQFSDSNGTTLDAAVNSINPANTWVLSGNSWDPSEVTNGSFRITKSTTNLSNAHIDIANVTTGKVWLVAEIDGWNFTATPSSPSEEVRFAFLDNDNSPPSGSTITAQMDIGRSGSGLALFGRGALGTGAQPITGSYALPLVRSDPFIMVLELDKNADQYSVYYKDGNAPFAQLGTPANLGDSTLNPGKRDGNSIRFAPTGSFNDVGEFFDINRIYLTDTTPIVGPVDPTTLTLEVKSNGQVAIRNDTNVPITFNSYRIGFTNLATQDLNFAGWNSLAMQGIDAVGGGDDPGEKWTQAGGSSDKVLAESFLLGSSTISNVEPNNLLSLGSAFKPGGAHELLTFEYHDVTSGTIVAGEIDFVIVAGLDGDYNQNGKVDAADYVLWRKDPSAHGGSPAGYNTWRANFGMSSPGAGSGLAAAGVPEPATLWLVGLSMLVLVARRLRVA